MTTPPDKSPSEMDFPDGPPPLLLFPDADKSPRRHVSCNAALAHVDHSEIDAAKKILFDSITPEWHNQAGGEVPFQVLSPRRAAEDATQQIFSRSEIVTAPSDLQEVEERLSQLVALSGRAASAHRQPVDQAALDAVVARFNQLRGIIETLATEHPFSLGQIVEQGLHHLDTLAYKEPENESLPKIRRIIDALKNVSKETSEIPKHKRPVLERRLLDKIDGLSRQALTAIVENATHREFKKKAASLRADLKDWGSKATACDACIKEARRAFADRLDAEQQRRAKSEFGSELLLSGPSCDEVLQHVKESFDDNVDGSSSELLDSFQAELAGTEANAKPFWELASTDLVSALDRIIDPALADYTFYRAAEKFGTRAVADDLYACAEPLLHLERSSPLLGVELTEAVVATLPPAGNKQDKQTAKAISDALKKRCPMIKIMRVDAGIDGLEIVRSKSGFCAAILSDNRVLALHYSESRKLNHHPHLFGVSDYSTDGLASECVVELINKIIDQTED